MTAPLGGAETGGYVPSPAVRDALLTIIHLAYGGDTYEEMSDDCGVLWAAIGSEIESLRSQLAELRRENGLLGEAAAACDHLWSQTGMDSVQAAQWIKEQRSRLGEPERPPAEDPDVSPGGYWKRIVPVSSPTAEVEAAIRKFRNAAVGLGELEWETDQAYIAAHRKETDDAEEGLRAALRSREATIRAEERERCAADLEENGLPVSAAVVRGRTG